MLMMLAALVLAASPLHAQEEPAVEARNEPHDGNRVTEIPGAAVDSDASSEDQTGSDSQVPEQDPEQINEEPQQPVAPDGPARFADLKEFVTNDDVYESPIGALLQRNCSELAGQMACGLAVLEVRAGGPAAAAGIRPYSGLIHTLLGATAVAAAMFFPPAFAAIGLVDRSRVGEAFDLIIGVDGRRINAIADFQSAMAEVRFGDVLYLTIVRHGKRLQVPVRIMN